MNTKMNNFGRWGWSMIIYAFICYAVSAISTVDGVNIYPTAFSALRGWNSTQIMSVSTFAGWISIIGMVLFSQLTAKKGIRLVSSVSTIIMGILLIVFAKSTSFPVFAFSIIAINFIGGTALLNSTPSTLINKWFPKKKNLAFGWATMGMPFSSLALIPLLQFGFTRGGVDSTYLIFGIAVIIFGIATIFWVKNSPEEIGLLPDNEEVTEEDHITEAIEAEKIREAEKQWTIINLFKNRNTWCIGIGFGLIWLTVVGIVSQLIPRLILDCGYAPPKATMMLSIAAGIGIIGSYFWGWLDLKLTTKKASLFYGFWFVAVLILLLLPPSEGLNWITTVIVGIGIGGVGNLIPSLMGTCYGRHGYVYASRVISPINTIVRSCAFILVATVLSMAGSYRQVYMVLLATTIIGTIILFAVKTPSVSEEQA
jgi:OFA family oxalate/formate antiporter-like MFS transporter